MPQGGVVPTMGKEFWLGFMQNWTGVVPPYQAIVFISGPTNTSGVVRIPGTGWESSFNVVAGQTTTVEVPMALALNLGSEAVQQRGVSVVTEDTVSVYAINYESFSSDGTVVLPMASLGIDYRVVGYRGFLAQYSALSEFLVVATRDGTEVEITPTALTAAGRPAGVPFLVQLDSGQTYQVQAYEPEADLTGSRIRGTEQSGACRPFAVFSGASCANVPNQCAACDHLVEQNFPVSIWGTSYRAVPFLSTLNYYLRVMAHEDATTVWIGNAPPVVLNAGEWQDVMSAVEGLCIEADKPVVAAQYLKGAYCVGTGDPAMLFLNSMGQLMTGVTFATVPSTLVAAHYLNIVLPSEHVASMVLDGAPVPAGQFSFFAQCPEWSFARLTISEGSHTLANPGGFSAYVYGTGFEESYAYSTGAFSPLPPVQPDSVLCGTDISGEVTLVSPMPLDGAYWSLADSPADTLQSGLTYTFEPETSDLYMVSGTEFISQCPRQFFFSVELTDPPTLVLEASELSVCAYTEVQMEVFADPPGIYVHAWSGPQGPIGQNAPTLTVVPVSSAWYWVTVSTLDGCMTVMDSIWIEVVEADVVLFHTDPQLVVACPGETVQLGLDVATVSVSDGLDGPLGPLWQNVQGASFSTACGALSGNALFFNGGIMRWAETVDLDVGAGGMLRFAIVFGTGAAPCADAGFGNDVVLEYSTNGGGAWNDLAILYEWAYPNWTVVELPIPAPAQSTSTRFRWRQSGSFSAGTDNWALDQVVIAVHGATGLDLLWSPATGLSDATVAEPWLTVSTGGWYFITGFDPITGCTYQDSVLVQVPGPFDISVWADGGQACSALGTVLHVDHDVPDAVVTWEPAQYLAEPNSSSTAILLDSTMWYVVQVAGLEGCTLTDSIQVVVPFSDLVTEQTVAVCEGESITLEVDPDGVTFLWNTGDDGPSLQVSESGTYTVTLLTMSGCEATVAFEVTVYPLPEVDLGPDLEQCNEGGLLLSTIGGSGDVLWSTGETTASIEVNSSGTYWVMLTAVTGCMASDTVQVILHPLPGVQISDVALCEGATAVLDATTDGAVAYLWNTGAATPDIQVGSASGTFWVQVTNAFGCEASDTAVVEVVVPPTVDLGDDLDICEGAEVLLSVDAPQAAVVWSTGHNGPGITVAAGGMYQVFVTLGPCTVTDSVQVAVYPAPDGVDRADYQACLEDLPDGLELMGGDPADAHLWSTGATGATIMVTQPGMYTVVITGPQGCVQMDTIKVTDACPPSLYVPNAFTPDGDGINELFRPVGAGIHDMVLEIFNRWGELIHRSEGDAVSWDGTYGGGPVQDGVYVWRIAYSAWSDEQGRPMRQPPVMGHVVLLR